MNTPTWQFSTRPAVPEYCRATPADLTPFFRKPGVIDDQHPVRVAEVLNHVVTDIVTHGVDVPVRPPQQPLHTVR